MSKNVKKAAGITYEPHELKAIKQIAALVFKQNNAAFEIGKLTDELVKLAGGTVYGEAVLHKITQHHDIQCSEQHLRRCWRYYQVFSQYGERLEKFGLCESALYELARFLDRGMPQQDEWGYIRACAQTAVDKSMTVEQVSAMVSGELDKLGKMRKPARRPRKSNVRQPETSGKDAQQAAWHHESISVFRGAAEVFEKLVPAETRANFGRNELCRGVVSVLRPLIQITESLTKDGPDEDLATTLEGFGAKLIVCARIFRGEGQSKIPQPAATPITSIAEVTDKAVLTAASNGAVVSTNKRNGRGRPRKHSSTTSVAVVDMGTTEGIAA